MPHLKTSMVLSVLFSATLPALSGAALADDVPSVDALIEALSKKNAPAEKVRSFVPSALDAQGSSAGGGTGPQKPLVSLQTVEFELDSAELTSLGRETLDRVVQAFKTIAKTRSLAPACGTGFRLVGHTDARGSDTYNKDLSYRRAETARAYLLSHGVSAVFNVEGKGETQLKNPANPEDGANRRVEIDCGA